MDFVTVEEIAAKWGLTPRQARSYCATGRVGRLILLKECLKHGITPFVIAENFKRFYYLGLEDWRHGRRVRLMDVCRTGQDAFILGLRRFGHTKLAEKAEATQKTSERHGA